ncbi:MAG TPA: M14 family zinc carboxypeptidase, partial [Candidatus Xenobia bacterium]
MVRRAFLVLLALVWLGRPVVAAPVTPWETTGHFTTMAQLAEFLHGLSSRGSWKVSVQSAGQSSIEHKPIWAVRLTPPSPELKVMILARVHGNEPAATESALTLIRDIVSDQGDKAGMYRQCEFLVVPCLNPEGAEKAQAEADGNDGWWGSLGRDNDEELDINRDYLRLSTSEARTAVALYNNFQPSLVMDLHEFESRPLVAGDGWWRAEYWDLLIGAGRAPWASPALRTYCRTVAQDVLFPKLDGQGVRTEYYMLPSGSFDSSMHFASNAADYFLVR